MLFFSNTYTHLNSSFVSVYIMNAFEDIFVTYFCDFKQNILAIQS